MMRHINKLDMARTFMALGTSVFLAMPSHLSASSVILATGETSGVYHGLGLSVAQASRAQNFDISVLSTNGSVENIHLLAAKKVDLCFSQSDVAHDAYHGLGTFERKYTELRFIGSMYTETVHILVRRPLYINRVEDLRGKRVAIGLKGSGTESNARTILEVAGIAPSELELINMPTQDAPTSLKRNEIDAAFETSEAPSPSISRALNNGSARLLSLNVKFAQRLLTRRPCFVLGDIPKAAYAPHTKRPVKTVTVAALLLARDDLPDSISEHLVRSLSLVSRGRGPEDRLPIPRFDETRDGATLPEASGVKAYYMKNPLRWALRNLRSFDFFSIIPYLLVILSVAAIAYGFKYAKRVPGKNLIRIALGMAAILLLNTLLLYFCEKDVNEDYAKPIRALWSAMVNTFSFGSKEPYTPLGRTTSTVASVLWAAGLTWLTAQFVAMLIERHVKGTRPMKNHYVILNWNPQARSIIEELRSPDIEGEGVAVISNSDQAKALHEQHDGEIAYVYQGDPCDEDLLRKAQIHNAHSIVVLADERHDGDSSLADTRTILILLKALQACANPGHPLIRKKKHPAIVVEIKDPQNVDMVASIASSKGVAIESVSTRLLGGKLLAQSVVTPGVSRLYTDLLTFDSSLADQNRRHGREIYKAEIPSSPYLKSFRDLMQSALESDYHILPVALANDDEIRINPRRSGDENHSDDLLVGYTHYFAIASEARNLRDFNREMEAKASNS